MPMYAQKFQKHAVAEELGWRGMNISNFLSLTDEQVNFIIEKVKSYFL
jgi:perosamine synthetase